MQDSTNASTQHRDSNDRDRAPEAIRRDIRETRGDMDRTVDELLDRFSVGSLVDEAWRRMRQGGGAGGMDVGGMFRDHPVPIALVGLGLGWLAVEQANGRSESAGKVDWTTRTGGNGVTDKDSGIADKFSDMTDKVSDMKESTQAAGARTRAGFQELLTESPLTVGSIVFGLGLASGLALPTSDLEDRQMGEMSDRVKSKARKVGSDVAHRAADVGHDVADTAVSRTQEEVEDIRNPDAGEEPSRTS